ncbi:hypothetical protein LQ327_05420 [Actinomycetospora endophytica]|uniref:Antibiotic biosynthesis monooxygenase n=1 Tax=Actinomycetospora endophytica TaxID=2291215 RepID=A0ABS8P3J8_9PSEU|nr:hypothetical protein [Actinomycetospora endophytica]MCD2192827.1 hypothetical protein [Actinomycetospora endophytica]
MYAVLVTVRIDQSRSQEAMDDLATMVVPTTKATPGFIRGTWFSGEGTGHAMVLFDTREHADQMAARHATPPDGPVQIESIRTYEVRAEA